MIDAINDTSDTTTKFATPYLDPRRTTEAFARIREHSPLGRTKELKAKLCELLDARATDHSWQANWQRDVLVSNAIEHARREGHAGNWYYILRDVVKMQRTIRKGVPVITEQKRQEILNNSYIQSHQGVNMSSEADPFFPRTDDGQPAPEKPSLGDASAEPPDDKPAHFSADKAWRVEYNKLRSKRLETATMKDGPFTLMVKEIIGIGGKSFKTLTCTGDEALQMIDNALRIKYEPKTDERKDSPSDAITGQTPVVPGSIKVTEPTKTERSSAPETSIVNPSDKISEIREKFNAPQRGKDYLTVQGRVALFRLKFPMGTIDTEAVLIDGDQAVFKARISVDAVVLSTGFARATLKGTTNLGGRYIEKAETAAIGRALAVAGFGTDDSLDDSDYLSDSPIERKAA